MLRKHLMACLRIVVSNEMQQLTKETIMWTKPAATEMRFGFEVTMYVMNK